MLDRVHTFVLITFAALLGLFEGPAEIACVAVILSAAALRVRDGGLAALRPRHASWVLAGIVLWALAGLPGTLLAPERVSSENALRPLLALGFFAGALAIPRDDPRTLRRMAIAFALCMVVNGAYGFLQLKYGALPLDAWLLKNPKSPQIYVPDRAIDPYAANPNPGLRGVSGLFYNRLKLAHMGAVALGLLVLLAVRRESSKALRIAAAVGFAILAAAVALTYARMALAAFAAGLAVVALVVLIGRDRRRLLLAAGLGAAGAGGVALFVKLSDHAQRRLATAWDDLALRRGIFESALAMFRDHPLRGVGHGVYSQKAASYLPEGASRVWRIDAHNLFLHVLAETGIAGTLGFSVAIGAALAALVRRVRADRGAPESSAVLDRFALFGIMVVAALGVTHFPLHHAPVALVFWTLVGVAEGNAWRRRANARNETSESPGSASPSNTRPAPSPR